MAITTVTTTSIDVAAYRALFPITERFAFLNHASISTPSVRTTDAVAEHLRRVQTEPFDALRLEVEGMVEDLKARVCTLIGAARTDEVVPMPNTAMGMNTAAHSLPLGPGDNVLVLDGDYPATIYPWMNLAPKGVLTKVAPQKGGGLDLAALEARIDRRTRAVAISTAIFATGYRNDLVALGSLCRERGLYFVVDGIQSLGAFPLDVRECNVDFLACGAHKWLLGTPGAGFLYCRHELLDELAPGAYVGAFSVVDPWNFLDYNLTPPDTSERFNIGTQNLPGLVALHASLGMLLEVGADNIAERITGLTDVLIEDLQRRGYRILSNLDPATRSGIVIVEVQAPQATYERLLAAGVVTAPRGAGLRISPHFYNTEEDVLRVGEELGNR